MARKANIKPSEITSTRLKSPKLIKRLPSAWQLTKSVFQLLNANKQLFLGIALVYGLLSLVLVQGLAKTSDVSSLKSDLSQSIKGNFGALTSSLTLFMTLVGSSANNSVAGSSAYQLFLGLIASLATIWAIRQVLTGSKIRIRDAYYKGMSPLVPFILVLLVIGLELLPLLIGATIYSIVTTNGIAVSAIEKILWGTLFAVLSLVSLYLISSSTFALYISTLADMTPVKALRSASKLVKGRRSQVVRKLLFLPVFLSVISSLIMLPVLFWITPITPWIFYSLTVFSVIVVNAYIYLLYRELLNE
jgi:hypothetical protein